MSPRPRRWISLLVTLTFALIGAIPSALATGPNVAFYYGHDIPVNSLGVFDWLVVEADNVDEQQQAALQAAGSELFAYLSVGEVARSRPWHGEIKAEWIRGENPAWASDIMDLSSDGWRGYLTGQRMQSLWDRGYRAFFLDTMDSYHAIAKGPAELESQRLALAEIIRLMHQRFPGVQLLFNRGFEILKDTQGLVAGVAAESLYQGWNPGTQNYREVPPADREWLSARLNEARALGLPAIAIDYVDPADKPLARATAQRILNDGFIPWVSTPELDRIGIGSVEPISRRVLVAYDGSQQKLQYAEAHRFLATPLEAMGYAVDYLDVSGPLPERDLTDRYAGMATWLLGGTAAHAARYGRWLKQQLKAGLPVAILSSWGFEPDAEVLAYFNLESVNESPKAPMKVLSKSAAMGFEAKARALAADTPGWRSADSQDGGSWFVLEGADGRRFDPVTISKAGGVALYPYVLESRDELDAWIIDPFTFLREALRLEQIPAPDLTTENGSRYLTTHIDGDGFYNISFTRGNRYAAEVILEEIIQPSPLPHTFSIVEGEIGPTGLKPKLSPTMEDIARRIFREDNVELASHSYAHPFDWSKAMKARLSNYEGITLPEGGAKTITYKLEGKGNEIPHLAIPGYRYSPEREVKGSIDYINRELAPPGKQAKVMLWSGTALPNKEDLAWAERIGVVNMNGGDTIITRDRPYVTQVSASGRPVPPYFQVYAPIQNENIYTNLWTGPHWGFIRAIESYKLTDSPRRLKPISIYYHSYSGDYPASVKALNRVYDWAMKQQPLPLFVSEYAPVVTDFQRVALARDAQGRWAVRGSGDLRSLRLSEEQGWPDLERSQGVAGVRELPQGRYVHLIPGEPVRLALTSQRPTKPHLVRSNARLLAWTQSADKIDLRLKGHLPIELEIGAIANSCRLKLGNGQTITAQAEKGTAVFKLTLKDTGNAALLCP
ncbi:MAG: bifunctional glycoside hydrolase 114/ polysaccharide deacetylase family protein [Gammaproteobacteria bacterium]